uniref:Filamin binding LIM protein 1 n=1 Tax=Oncorhynchus mykiss TaxID=8022 RepID=A0A8C7WIT0_ONCMY
MLYLTTQRMVSSFFIILASPYKATVTQHQHTCTHSATANDMPRTAIRVGPEDSSTRKLSERAPSESQGSTHEGAQSSTPSLARHSEPRTPASPVTPDLSRGLGDTQQQQTEDLTPLLPPPHMSVDAELTEDPTPLLPPPLVQEPPTAPLLQPVSLDRPPVSDQLVRLTLHPRLLVVCGFCRKPVALSETAIKALNRSHSVRTATRYDKLDSASLELGWVCGEVIKDQIICALERAYHPLCFICATCSQPIGEQSFAQGEVGEVYCLWDYYRKYAPQCSACQQLIIPREDGIDSYTVECLGRSFHVDCYRCDVCSTQLSPEPIDHGCHPLDGRVLCKSCLYHSLCCHLTTVQSAQL